MKQYHDFLQNILDRGIVKEDRTGTGTISLFGPQMEFDLSKGFPLLTTKKMFTKGIIAELLWFLEGSTDERRLAEIQYGLPREELVGKTTIWTANADAKRDDIRFNGTTIGKMYGTYWRQLPIKNPLSYIYIKKQDFKNESYVITHPDIKYRMYYKSGEKVLTKNNGQYTILGKALNNDYIVVRFDDTGYITETPKANKNVKDRLKPNVQGVGYYGYGNMDTSTTTYKKLYGIWQFMLLRCYRPKENHKSYNDVKVCDRWKNFTEFYHDAFSLKNFQEFVDSEYKYQLDKDFYGSKLYCKEACIFISAKMNKTLNTGSTRDFKVYRIDGKSFYSKTDLENYLFGKRKKLSEERLSNIGVEILKDNKTHLIRPKLFIDQISDIIEEIKTNPDSRRLVLNAWNIEHDRNAVLGACHNMFQFYVSNGKLDCKLYQRSADAFLGVPYNIASYALLTMMIAQVCDLEPGRFIHTFGDAHIYSNHIEQVKEQLLRDYDKYKLPDMQINPLITSIDDFTMNDFIVTDYQSYPSIKAEMAV